MRAPTVLGALSVAFFACNRASAPPPTLHGGLGGDVVARVGDALVPGSLVGAVAGAQHTDVRTALDRLIDDALAAQAARARRDDREPTVAWTLTSITGRALAEHVRSQAVAQGPPTDAEVAELSRVHWLDVDVPESVRAAHAVVLRPKDATQLDAARALAARIAAAVAGAKDEADFEARAKAIPAGTFDVRVENLPTPFVEDGRNVSPDRSYLDPAFARGAFTLEHPGDVSGVIESSFGWHVIRLLERIPPKLMPSEQRRVAFADETVTHRERAQLDAILRARRGSTPVEILPDADARMADFGVPGSR